MNVDNFVLLSCMTKTEIINYIKSTANPDIKRVYHSKTWEQRLLRIIEGSSYDNVEEKIDTLIQTGKVRKQGNEMDSRKDKK
jgi:replication fork clamp-binding protein CrfC